MKLARMSDGRPEIFHTLQGEGRNLGRPSVFIRASLCNLHCHWCDTPYTWNWKGSNFDHEREQKFQRDEEIIDLSTEAIIEEVSRFPCRNFVLTGGEPLLQERGWLDLMERLDGHYEIETNGTVFPGEEFLERLDQINVSPKLSNSGIDESKRRKPDVLCQFVRTEKADFKFVVGNETDLAEVLALVAEADLPADRVFLMPKASSVAELETRQEMVSAWALENKFRYSDRLHLRLYGAKRGV
ncbi:MAG: 7-carboxy-7-deazaguanine synthase QueE [Verrucomicrobiota bacterium]